MLRHSRFPGRLWIVLIAGRRQPKSQPRPAGSRGPTVRRLPALSMRSIDDPLALPTSKTPENLFMTLTTSISISSGRFCGRAAALCLLFCLQTAPIHAATFTTVALTGDTAPGTGGAEYKFFETPSINVVGDIAFAAELRSGPTGTSVTSDNEKALFGPTAGAGSALGLIVREGTPVPNGDGAEFTSLGSPTLNATGDLTFQAALRTGSTGPEVTGRNARALFGPTAGPGSSLALLARQGDPAPEAGGATFDFFSGVPALNDNADVAYQAFLNTGSGPPVTFENREAIYGPSAGAGSARGLIARGGDPVPGLSGILYESFDPPVLNAAGDVAFMGSIRTDGVAGSAAYSEAIFGPAAGAGSALGLLVREDAAAPDTDGAVFSSLKSPSLNNSGEIAFKAVLRTGDTGPTITSANNFALFSPTGGTGSPLCLLVQSDDPTPGIADAEFSNFGDPALNAAGDVAFFGLIRAGDSGPAISSDDDGVLFAYVDGRFQLIARQGDVFTVSSDGGTTEDRTISFIDFSPQRGLSNDRELAFQLGFTDGTQGIFRHDLTLGGTVALTAGAGQTFDSAGGVADPGNVSLLMDTTTAGVLEVDQPPESLAAFVGSRPELGDLPDGFELAADGEGADQFWTINYSGEFDSAEVTFTYDDQAIEELEEDVLGVLHWVEGSGWIEESSQIDTLLNTITIEVDTFSPFVLVLVPEPAGIGIVVLVPLLLRRRVAGAKCPGD